MDLNTLQSVVNQLTQSKIQSGEYVGSLLGAQGTGLGVYPLNGNKSVHESASRSERNLSVIFDHLISPTEVVKNTLGTVMNVSNKKYDVNFIQGEWDNSENRILEVVIDHFSSTDEINRTVNLIKNNKEAQNFIENLYHKGITDIVFSSSNRHYIFTYFFYNLQS